MNDLQVLPKTNTVTLCENTLDPSTWTTHEGVDDVREFLVEHFDGVWPDTARIYLDHVAKNSDITPSDQAGIDRLGRVRGHFFVVVFPEGIELILIIVAVAVAAISIALTFLFRPSTPNTKNQQEGSANNSLGDRQNQARPNQRILDIFGTLQTTFDLLAVPYRTFDTSGFELEHCYMCIGRGSYTIDPNTICDGTTRLNQMAGCQFGIYGPNSSPNGGSPLVTFGASITERIVNLQLFNGVNGQILRAPNIGTLNSDLNMAFKSPNQIVNDGSIDFTKYFTVGDSCTVADGGEGYYSNLFQGTYVISAVTSSAISFLSPQLVNPRWSTLTGQTPFGAGPPDTFVQLIDNTTAWVPGGTLGAFFIANTQMTEIWCNFVAPNGAYWIDKNGTKWPLDITLSVGITPADQNGNAIAGAFEQISTVTIHGSGHVQEQIGATLKVSLGTANLFGGVLLRARRSSNTVTDANTSTSDQCQWRDCYIIAPVSQANFGNVTTIQTIIRPTLEAITVQERKMNAIVTRNIPALVSGVFTGLAPSSNAADIICAMALDSFIGNRTLAELDVTGIYAVAGPGGLVETYFAVLADQTAPAQFSYTFDDTKVSFEESVTDIATAICCVAYRRGSVISLSFEQQTNNSTLLFNHRNKIPKSETRTIAFGTLNDNDGINLTYTEPNAPNYPGVDTPVTLYFPPNQSAVNPKQVTAIGVRNVYQAKILGWRFYNKLIYQTTSVEFDATEEAALLVLMDRVSVADNTRSDTQDGEVTAQSSLLLTLSQNVVFDARYTYTIFLQHPDETVEAIPITAGSNPNQVILGFAPTLPCIIDPGNYANTTYMIVSSVAVAPSAFLLSEKTPKDGKQFTLRCINYSDSYYQNDTDFKTNMTVDGLYLEVMAPAPGPHGIFDDLHLEVMINGPGSGGLVEGEYLEVLTLTLPPHFDVDSVYLEVMTSTTPPNADMDSLYIEVMSH